MAVVEAGLLCSGQAQRRVARKASCLVRLASIAKGPRRAGWMVAHRSAALDRKTVSYVIALVCVGSIGVWGGEVQEVVLLLLAASV